MEHFSLMPAKKPTNWNFTMAFLVLSSIYVKCCSGSVAQEILSAEFDGCLLRSEGVEKDDSRTFILSSTARLATQKYSSRCSQVKVIKIYKANDLANTGL